MVHFRDTAVSTSLGDYSISFAIVKMLLPRLIYEKRVDCALEQSKDMTTHRHIVEDERFNVCEADMLAMPQMICTPSSRRTFQKL